MPRRSTRPLLLLAALMLCSGHAFAAVDLVLNNDDTGYDPVPAGGIVQYTLRVDNNSSSAASDVVLTDTLPNGVTFVSSTTTQGTCAAPVGSVLTCQLGTIAAYDDATVVILVRAHDAGTITNTASATSVEPDSDPSNNTDVTQDTTVRQGADLELGLSTDTSSVTAGGTLGYTLQVTNHGPHDATDVRVSGNLPPDFSLTGNLPAGCSIAGVLLTCNVPGSVAVGSTYPLGPIFGQIGAGGGSTLTFAASVEVASATAPQDPESDNNTAVLDTPVTPGSDIGIVKSASVASPVLTGTVFNYTLTTKYTGDVPSNLVVQDAIPANFAVVSPASFSSNGWACTVVGQLLDCRRATGGTSPGHGMAIGDIVVQVRADTAGTGVINEATVSSDTSDPNPFNNTAQATLTVVMPTADLSAHKAGPNPALASAGSPWQWSIRMDNAGPADFVGQAIMTDTLPLSLTIESYQGGSGWSCLPAAPFTTAAGNNTITCTRDYTAAAPLASGGNGGLLTYNVSTDTPGSYTNTMCVSSAASGGYTPPLDGHAANDCASSGVEVQPSADSADLILLKRFDHPALYAGEVLTYTLEIVNAGPHTASNVVLSDTFDNLINNQIGPANGLVSIVTVAGNSSGTTCSTSPGTNRRALSCPYVSVPPCTPRSTCPTVTVAVRPGGDGGTRVNIADVVSTTTADPNYGNNGASATNTVLQRADVTVTKTATPSPAVAGQDLEYVIHAKNNGPSRADNVSISDELPLDVTFVSAVASNNGTCTAAPVSGTTTAVGNRQLICGWPSLANNQTRTVTVTVRPNSVTRGTTLLNTVQISTGTVESDTTNNSGSVSVPVAEPRLDLQAQINDNPDPVAIGDEMVYMLTAINNGPSHAESVQVHHQLPADKLSFVSATPSAGTCSVVPAVGSLGGILECNVGLLASGGSATVAVRMLGVEKGSTSGAGTVLTVSSAETRANPGFDSNPVNNVVDEKTTVRPKADMEVVSKTAVPGTVGLREAFNYQIVVRNNGVGVADGVVVSDTLPTGMQLTATPTVAPVNPGDFPGTVACTGAIGGSSFTCSLGDDVAVSAVATITVPVIITTAPAGVSPGTLSNTASVATTSKDENPGNNSKTGPVTVETASLAGLVYHDANDNGVSDVSEGGIGGVTITLNGTAPDGEPVSFTTTTDADGRYSFDKLPAGTYTLTETQPAGWLDGKDHVGTAGGSAAAVPGDTINGIVLDKNTQASSYDFGELRGGSLSGTVYRDLNNDGLIGGAGETGIAGVTLTLTGTDDLGAAVNQTATTDGSGNYSFTGLRPSDGSGYTITETQPADHLPGKATPGTGTVVAGTASADGNTIAGIVMQDGQRVGVAFNFGELPPTGLSGMVYVDANGNGLRDPAETAGVAGVTLTLSGIDDLGATVGPITTTTDASGAYRFDDLRPGTYQIVETQPAQWDNGATNVGTINGTPRGNGTVSDTISAIVLAAGEAGVDYDFGELGHGLGGFVYVDLNGNGVRDAGEPGIAGVTVTVTNLGTSATESLVTDASGGYLFTNLPAGNYSISETQPTQYADGAESIGSLGGTLGANDLIDAIPLGVGEVGTNYNFGELAGTLDGRVYVDLDGNGAYAPGEPGIAGVNVTLTGTDIDGNAVNVSTTTDADGNYVFTHLLPSNPAGYTLTETQPTAYADGAETVGDLGGTVGAAGTSVISGIPVGPGAKGNGYNFGELTGGLAGVVFFDLNNDGVFDAAEQGIEGVSLRLTGTDIDGKPVDVSVVTGPSGSYLFTGLTTADPSGYTITETQPADYFDGKRVGGLVDGVACATCDTGTTNRIGQIPFDPAQSFTSFNFPELKGSSLTGSVYDDIDRNGALDPDEALAGVTVTLTGVDDLNQPVTLTTTTAADGSYRFDGLRPGTYVVTETQPTGMGDTGASVGSAGGTVSGTDIISGIVLDAGVDATGYDFIDRSGVLRGQVFLDSNGDGIKGAGEPGLPGVTITLSGASSHTVVTDADGRYQFTGLLAGTYVITETQPADYADGGVIVGSEGGTAGVNVIDAITLPAGARGTNYDFPELPTGTLVGTVYRDTNNDGQQGGADETGIAGVTVTLRGTDDLGQPVSETTTTAADGSYRFDNLRPGTYDIIETQPVDYLPGKAAVGTGATGAGTVATDGNAINGIVLGVGETGSGFDFGELAGASIAGLVYLDLDNNGVSGGTGESGIAGVTVALNGTDDLGQVVSLTTTTAADGSYRFDNLRPGRYDVVETQPADYLPGKAAAGTDTTGAGSAAADGNAITGIVLGAGEQGVAFDFGELSQGTIGGKVYLDLNNDGEPGTGEAGLADVTIVLTGTDDDGNPVDRTVQTGPDGGYAFPDLPKAGPDGYTVTETQPQDYIDGKPVTGTVDGVPCTVCDSGTINRITSIPFDPAKMFTGFDFAEVQTSSLGGYVYRDLNGNGVMEPGEGLGDVIVTLTGTDDLGVEITLSQTTAADGSYRFDDLRPGTYVLVETQPVKYEDGGVQVGSLGGVEGTNRIDGIELTSGSSGTDYNFPELAGADGSIAGTVWLNQPGGNAQSQDPGEQGLEGWFVELYKGGEPVPGVERVTTDAKGEYLITGVPADSGYEVRFLSPNGTHYGYPVSQDADPQWNGTVDKTAAIPAITGVTVGSGVAVTKQDLPVDHGGIVYDSVTRQPLAGVRVTLLDPSGQPVAPQHLAGGETNLTQTTDASGYYQFLLLPGAPSGNYTLRIEQPDGYLPAPSGIHAPTSGSLTVPAGNVPYAVSNLTGPSATGDLPPYYLGFVMTPLSAGVTGNHIPLDPVMEGALRVRKTTPKVNVTKGDLVPYTIELTNTLTSPLSNIAARDLVPAGFKYRADSARVDGVPNEPLINGRELSWPDLSFGPSQTRTVQLVLIVGSGVGEGEYVNQAWAHNTIADRIVSNIGNAAVRVVPDPTFDCADLIGKVFDDRNGNGYQDQGEPGVPAVRVATARGLLVTTDDQGRYHIPCAAVPEHARGANFIIKLDERSLPTGFRMTTENPGDVRVTAGKMAKINFGVTIHRVLRLDVNAAAFEADGKTLLPTWNAQLTQLYASAQERPSVVRIAYHLAAGEDRSRANQRATTLRKQITSDWNKQGRQYLLQVEQEIIEVQP